MSYASLPHADALPLDAPLYVDVPLRDAPLYVDVLLRVDVLLPVSVLPLRRPRLLW